MKRAQQSTEKAPAPRQSPQPVQNRGTLYVVATPIGNLADFSPRAVDVLRRVELVLAEDTRTFKRLAAHFALQTRALSYHDHND